MTDPLKEAIEQVAQWTAQANDYELRWLRAESKNRELVQRVWDQQAHMTRQEAIIKQLEEHAATQADTIKTLRGQLDEAMARIGGEAK